ncbi:CsiV family protein [Pseudomonas sp. Marseille-Q8238]
MRAFRHFTLLLCLLAPSAFADALYQIEVIVFRQAGEPVVASQPSPDDWATGAQPISGNERSVTLSDVAAKLNPGSGYQVLLHKAWEQSVSPAPEKFAFETGNEQFGHFPVEGIIALSQPERLVDIDADIWVNTFDGNGLLSGSERIKQRTRLKNGELTYLDHGSLGMLVKVTLL